MTDANGHRHIEVWELTRLQPHPKQAALFPEPPPHEVKELADDIRRTGLLQPVEVLPDGTIIAGHKRVAAATLLGWTEITVWVRDDLAGDAAAAERRLIEDNLTRRQLGPLGLARCYKRLKELESRREGRLFDFEYRELRDRIGRRLGVSGRTLDRHLRVLGTPQEVQNAVEAGTLPITVAEKVAGLPEPMQARVARKIKAGADPEKAIKAVLPKATGRHRKALGAKGAFLRCLRHGLDDLEGRVEQLGWYSPEEVSVLERAWAVIRRMRQQAKKSAADPKAAFDDLLIERVDDEADQPNEE